MENNRRLAINCVSGVVGTVLGGGLADTLVPNFHVSTQTEHFLAQPTPFNGVDVATVLGAVAGGAIAAFTSNAVFVFRGIHQERRKTPTR